MGIDKKRRDTPQSYTLLDSLMEQIPGKNNYGASIPAAGFDADVLSANPKEAGEKLNGANYHRPYKLSAKDAMGVDSTQRGYSDRLYVAMTTQDRIAGPSYTEADGTMVKTKVSYAIPMEIIYLTPLAKWNPYNIKYEEEGKVTGNGGENNPYSGSNRKTFFHTPDSFFSGKSEADAADTSKAGGVYIKNEDNDKVHTQASGVRIMFPKISDIEGIIRQRYPIMPIYGEGNTIWKRLNAFEDSLEGYQTHVSNDDAYFVLGISHSTVKTRHTHTIQISWKKFKDMRNDKSITMTITTTKAAAHTHDLVVFVDDDGKLTVQDCDDKKANEEKRVCFDHHPEKMYVL